MCVLDVYMFYSCLILCAFAYACTCVYTYLYIYIYTLIYLYRYVYVCVDVCAYIFIYNAFLQNPYANAIRGNCLTSQHISFDSKFILLCCFFSKFPGLRPMPPSAFAVRFGLRSLMLASGRAGVVPAEEAAPGALLFGPLRFLVLPGPSSFWFCWGLGGYVFHGTFLRTSLHRFLATCLSLSLPWVLLQYI